MSLKSIVLTSTVLASMGSTAFADCTMKCIARNPFNGDCITKVKVCDVGSPADWLEQAAKETKKLQDGITHLWHTVYGVLPENIRVQLNTHPFTIIGGAFGGLEGAALGAAIDELLYKTHVRLEKTKSYVQGAPDWKVAIYEEGMGLVTMSERDIVGEGQAANQALKNQIDGYHNTFLSCVQAAPDLNAGWDCYNTFEDALIALERAARRQ